MFGKIKNLIVLIIVAVIVLGLLPLNHAYGISNATYEVNPNVISVYGNFTIRFVTGSAIPGGGWIKISFPNGFELPCNCGGVGWHSSDFTINGINPTYNPDGNNGANLKYVNITLPANMNISQNSTVVINIKNTARIKNPTDSGTYPLKISTSSETAEYSTNAYEISYSYVSNVSFSLLRNTVASATSLVVSFSTGILGDLTEEEYINLRFDDHFFLPNYISPDKIKINGYKPSSTSIKGSVLQLAIPKGMKIESLGQVVVEIGENAGINNPLTPGFYSIKASTSKEPKEISSNLVEIKDKPFVKTDVIINPDKPDGDNGYYKTQPTLILLPQTNTGEVVQTFWHFDDESYKLFTLPIYVPEGSHTLYYYSVTASVKEEEKSMELKVDMTPPQVNIIAPSDGTVIGNPNCVVKGTISDNTTVERLSINGTNVEPDANGNFSYTLTLKEGENRISIVAEDIAGNVSENQLNITLNTVTPTLVVNSLSDWQVFNEATIPISGIVSPASDVTLTINGASAPINADGSFSYNLQLSNDGINPINIIVKHNISGNVASKNFVVVYKPAVSNNNITIVLKVGSKEAYINGEKKLLDVEPYVDPKSNRTVVPLRFISEAFGAAVDWDPVNKSVTIKFNSKEVVLQIANDQALVDGTFKKIDQAPVIKDGRTMVPLRFISEALGAKVDWNANTKTITITYQGE